ncbi:cell division topological specificity factor [Clostridia bacterium]|nr:cell division topological specificity factor [Clostridia bacterium]GHU76673.1 cell division topological specificity factor [Clostridia bacterium]
MMDFFSLFSKPQSKNIAKDRLKLVLVHDRANCSVDVLEMLKNDILRVIAKYMDIDDEELDIQLTQTKSDTNDQVPMLIANIPFKNVRPKEKDRE